MYEQKVTPEQALIEINNWLDAKKLSPKKREEKKDSIDVLVDAMVYGILTMDDDYNLTHNLIFPVGEADAVTTLTYKPRVSYEVITNRIKNIKGTDIFGLISGYASAITGQPMMLLGKLDTEDFTIVQSVVTFFM